MHASLSIAIGASVNLVAGSTEHQENFHRRYSCSKPGLHVGFVVVWVNDACTCVVVCKCRSCVVLLSSVYSCAGEGIFPAGLITGSSSVQHRFVYFAPYMTNLNSEEVNFFVCTLLSNEFSFSSRAFDEREGTKLMSREQDDNFYPM